MQFLQTKTCLKPATESVKQSNICPFLANLRSMNSSYLPSQLISITNQWPGLYKVGTNVLKLVKNWNKRKLKKLITHWANTYFKSTTKALEYGPWPFFCSGHVEFEQVIACVWTFLVPLLSTLNICWFALTHFSSMFHFYTPENVKWNIGRK